jgi:hypothetical protein
MRQPSRIRRVEAFGLVDQPQLFLFLLRKRGELLALDRDLVRLHLA